MPTQVYALYQVPANRLEYILKLALLTLNYDEEPTIVRSNIGARVFDIQAEQSESIRDFWIEQGVLTKVGSSQIQINTVGVNRINEYYRMNGEDRDPSEYQMEYIAAFYDVFVRTGRDEVLFNWTPRKMPSLLAVFYQYRDYWIHKQAVRQVNAETTNLTQLGIQLGKLYTKGEFDNPPIKYSGTRQVWWDYLSALSKLAEGTSAKLISDVDIADELGMPRSAVSHVGMELQEQGLIRAEGMPTVYMMCRLTAAGINAIEDDKLPEIMIPMSNNDFHGSNFNNSPLQVGNIRSQQNVAYTTQVDLKQVSDIIEQLLTITRNSDSTSTVQQQVENSLVGINALARSDDADEGMIKTLVGKLRDKIADKGIEWIGEAVKPQFLALYVELCNHLQIHVQGIQGMLGAS